MRFEAGLLLRGANGKTIVKRYDLGDFNNIDAGVNFTDAQAALDDIVGALDAVTDATIAETRLTFTDPLSTATPASGDLFENAMVNVWSLDEDDATAIEHISQIFIPAPVIGVFQGATGPSRDIVDVTDADLTQYVQQVADHAYISDGESIQTGTGDDGMVDGRRVIRKIRLGR